MEKVLIITYYWPPSGGAGVQRWLKFVKYLPGLGIQPHVYTVENGEYPSIDLSLEKDIPAEAIILKQPIWEPYTIFKKMTGKGKDTKLQMNFSDKKKVTFTQKLAVWIRGNFLIPDPRKFWIKPSVDYLEKYIVENQITKIISTGPPHSMHIIALKLRKKLDIKWIADFRDPWTKIDFYQDLNLTKWADRKHHRLEKEVLKTADEVITVSQTIAKDLEEIKGSRVSCITNGFDESDYLDKEIILDKKFTLSYIGNLNRDRVIPSFFTAIGELIQEIPELKKQLQLNFIGEFDQALNLELEKNGLVDKVNFTKHIAHSEVGGIQSKSQVLLLFINNVPSAKGVLTGKVFEYFAAKRPILGVGPLDGEIAEMFVRDGLPPILDFDDVNGIKLRVKALFQDFLKGEAKTQNGNILKYSRKSLTEELVKMVKEV